MRLRPSARGLLVDGDDHVLLAEHDLIDRPIWAAPGGGVEAGETPIEALRRELDEELGFQLDLDVARTLPHVWTRTIEVEGVVAGFDGVVEDYFLVRCERFEPRGRLTDAQLAAEHLVALRWWSLPEVADAKAAGTWFGPRHLDVLLGELLRDGPPPSPLPIGL